MHDNLSCDVCVHVSEESCFLSGNETADADVEQNDGIDGESLAVGSQVV